MISNSGLPVFSSSVNCIILKLFKRNQASAYSNHMKSCFCHYSQCHVEQITANERASYEKYSVVFFRPILPKTCLTTVKQPIEPDEHNFQHKLYFTTWMCNKTANQTIHCINSFFGKYLYDTWKVCSKIYSLP